MSISRSVKRLVLIIALSVIVILVSKSLLSKAVKNLNIEAEKKQQAKASKLPALPESAPALDKSPALEMSGPFIPAESNVATGVPISATPENSSAAR